VWYKILEADVRAASASAQTMQRWAETLCCDGCRGAECNARCVSETEGDWYHACFHGLGHGSILRALTRRGRLVADGVCRPPPWFSSAPTTSGLAEAEAGCDDAVVGRRRNRKFCMLGVYMSYFEYLRLEPVEWASACETAACPAACIIKCRQFASVLLEPILLQPPAEQPSWPSPLICYGRHPLSNDAALALDTRFSVYSDPLTLYDGALHRSIYEPGHGAVYTPEMEAWLFGAITPDDDDGHDTWRHTCFSV
jgi:hypothetical protein